METVFEANLALDAHLVRDLLERAGIPSRIDGEYLQGGVGELPPGGIVKVRVPPEHAVEARRIIAEWERSQPPDAQERSAAIVTSKKSSWAPYTFVLGGALGVLLGWIHWNTPATRDGVDYNGDGTLDERFFYAGTKMSGIEYDRNSDGRADVRFDYDSHGTVTESRSDDNFDGRFEDRTRFEHGQPHMSEIDRDGDGFAEQVGRYHHGVIAEWQYLSPQTRAARKLEHYRDGVLTSAGLDADGDGQFERHIEYDEIAEPKS